MIVSFAIGLIIAIFSFSLFGITGLRIFIGVIFVSFPFFMMLNNFDLAEGEKIVFSLTLGLTLFSSLAFLLGFLMSFRLSIAIVFLTVLMIAFLIGKFKRKVNQ